MDAGAPLAGTKIPAYAPVSVAAPSGHTAGTPGCGDYPLLPASCGALRAGCARDVEEIGVRLRLGRQQNMLICRNLMNKRRERRDSNPRPPAVRRHRLEPVTTRNCRLQQAF